VPIENIVDFAWDMFMPETSIPHFLSLPRVSIHRNKSRDERQVAEAFSGLFLAILQQVALFITVWALVIIAVWPNKTTARVYTTMIPLRLNA
jgi:hypothetical protein